MSKPNIFKLPPTSGTKVHVVVTLSAKSGKSCQLCIHDKIKDAHIINATHEDVKALTAGLTREEETQLKQFLKHFFQQRNQEESNNDSILPSSSSSASSSSQSAPTAVAADNKSKSKAGTHEAAIEKRKKMQEKEAAKQSKAAPTKKKPAPKEKKRQPLRPSSVPAVAKGSAASRQSLPGCKKAKPAELEHEVASASDEDDEDDEEKDEEDEKDAQPNVDADLLNMQMATRAPSKTARGHQRKLGKGKRSSAYAGHGENAEGDADSKKSKKRKVAATHGDAATGPNAVMPVLAGAEHLFRAQRVKSKGLQELSRKHSQRSAMMPSRDELLDFKKKLASTDPLAAERQSLAAKHLQGWSHWLWYMQLHYNLLFFGIGCKAQMIQEFVIDRLSGEDVLSIDGSKQDFMGLVGGNRIVKALLDTISSHILKQSALGASCLNIDGYARVVAAALDIHYCREKDRMMTASSSLSLDAAAMLATTASAADPAIAAAAQGGGGGGGGGGGDSSSFTWLAEYGKDTLGAEARIHQHRLHRTVSSVQPYSSMGHASEADPAWGGRYAHAQAKLYIVVNSIDGACLQSIESQRVLATLAECSSVSLLATSDKVNAPLLWGCQELSKFRWTYLHVPTYVDYEIQSDFALFNGAKGLVGQGHALEYILSSLTRDHRDLCALLAKDAVERKANENLSAASASSNFASKGIRFEDLFIITSKTLIAANKDRLHALLKELEDHRLLSVMTDSKRQEFVLMQLPIESMIKLSESVKK